MSFQRSSEPWEEMHRHGLHLANRLAHAFNGAVHHVFRHFPAPLRREDRQIFRPSRQVRADLRGRRVRAVNGFGMVADRPGDEGGSERSAVGGIEGLEKEEEVELEFRTIGGIRKPNGSINITSTYDSRTNGIESSLVARGELWGVEASHNSSTSRNENSTRSIVQIGPVLLVRDATLLFPVPLSKQHLLWYGYDRKDGIHFFCPSLWSEHKRWSLMSILFFKPFACTYLDMKFPNGRLTYVAGERLTTSAFLPAFGGLLQFQGQYPGETRFSFACKNKSGTRITPMVQWPDQSFSLEIIQTLDWKRSGLMLRPAIQCSICHTFGGSNPGLRTELLRSLNEKLTISCGHSGTNQPSVFASVALGRSKFNDNVGSSGVVVKVETPLAAIGRPFFSVQLNGGVEF